MSRRFGLFAVGLLAGAQFVPAGQFQLNYWDTIPVNGAWIYPASNPSDKTVFAQYTPISVTAIFNTSDPDLPFPAIDGQAIYGAWTPSMATVTIGGQTYQIDESGVKTDVVLFDQSTPLGNFIPDMKDHYGIGMIEDPLQDEAGFIADFSSATTKITQEDVLPTVFTHYNGSGFTPGSGNPVGCTSKEPITCTSFNQQPIELIGSDGQTYYLALGTWHDDSFYNQPGTNDALQPAQVSITAAPATMPEPSPSMLAFAGFALLIGGAGLKRLRF